VVDYCFGVVEVKVDVVDFVDVCEVGVLCVFDEYWEWVGLFGYL